MIAGSAIPNGRVPKSSLGPVFNSKLGRIGMLHVTLTKSPLKLKSWPRFHPVG